MKHPRQLELLAPARDAATAIAAIDHGADAVYIGGPGFGARSAAGNSVDDIALVADYAHRFGARVLVTLNTIIYNEEIAEVERLVDELYRAGVDALIVQDLGLLNMRISPVDLHASTQTDARNPAKVGLMARAGFSQIVIPREFSLEQISEAAAAAAPYGVKIEAFVHGALCVSYSGDCQAGEVLAGRSANRGQCPQICRLRFRLTDARGNPVNPDGRGASRHWLSLADMNRLDSLAAMADAGVSSFKIEGRLKSAAYVKNVTAAYSKSLDEIVAASGGRYVRASYGQSRPSFTPDVTRSFNRGFTSYFLTPDPANTAAITSWDSPKWMGRPVATLISSKGIALKIKTTSPIHNGDGLVYINGKGEATGFRVNRAEGDTVFAAPGATLPSKPGTRLYRNLDTEFESVLERRDSAIRKISVNIAVRPLPTGYIALDITDARGAAASVVSDEAFTDLSRSPQSAQRRDIFSRLGDTIYTLGELDDRLGDIFVPSKSLTALRRKAIEALDRDWRIIFGRNYRRKSILQGDELKDLTTSYHDNIANAEAEKFYTSLGATVAGHAIETEPAKGEVTVMTTRYCLRRSLGACFREGNARSLPSELYLEAPIGRLKLAFDCKNCQMHLIKT